MRNFKDFKALLRNILVFSGKIGESVSFNVVFCRGVDKGGTYITVVARGTSLDLIPEILKCFYDLTKMMPWADSFAIKMRLNYPKVEFITGFNFRVEMPFPEVFTRWKEKQTDRHYRYSLVKTGEWNPLRFIYFKK